MKSRPKKKRSISLVEVMIAASILGVAASVSIPEYMDEQFRKNQEECPQELQKIVAAEQEYFKKHDRYTVNLLELGWRPPTRPRYLYGFRQGPRQIDASPKGTANTTLSPNQFCNESAPGCFHSNLMVHTDGSPLSVEDLPETSFRAKYGFLIACVGNIDRDPDLDRLVIDQTGKLEHITNDLIDKK